MHTTSALLIAKTIAAIALTASTAGGVALATSSTATPHDSQDPTSVEQAATTEGSASYLAPTTPEPTDDTTGNVDETDRLDNTHGPRVGTSGGTGRDETSERKTPVAAGAGLCRALSNVSTTGHPGKAAVSPALAAAQCAGTGTTPDTDTQQENGTGTPAGPPSTPPGNPDQRIGKPDTTERPDKDVDRTENSDKAGETEKNGDKTEKSDRSGGRADEAGQDEADSNRSARDARSD